MKHRVKLAILTVLISMAGLGLVIVQGWRDNTPKTIIVNIPAAALSTTQPPTMQALAPSTQPAAYVAPIAAAMPADQTPAVIDDATTMHTAQRGETVDSLAAGLRHKETRAYRDAIIAANPSLKADPDKLIAGKTYVIPAAADIPAEGAAVVNAPAIELETKAPANAAVEPTAAAAPAATPTKELKYTAVFGDTVSHMAGAFLGSTDKDHQDVITDANASLKADPDHVVAGQAYKIRVTDGLNAAAEPRPTTQPEADAIIAPPKLLRYTARTGDTVTSMAIALLGSDTLATRNAIIDNNPSLKTDPNLVITGQIYSIPAPVAVIDPR